MWKLVLIGFFLAGSVRESSGARTLCLSLSLARALSPFSPLCSLALSEYRYLSFSFSLSFFFLFPIYSRAPFTYWIAQVDYCAGVTCDVLSSCVAQPTIGSFYCTPCPAGFVGNSSALGGCQGVRRDQDNWVFFFFLFFFRLTIAIKTHSRFLWEAWVGGGEGGS